MRKNSRWFKDIHLGTEAYRFRMKRKIPRERERNIFLLLAYFSRAGRPLFPGLSSSLYPGGMVALPGEERLLCRKTLQGLCDHGLEIRLHSGYLNACLPCGNFLCCSIRYVTKRNNGALVLGTGNFSGIEPETAPGFSASLVKIYPIHLFYDYSITFLQIFHFIYTPVIHILFTFLFFLLSRT